MRVACGCAPLARLLFAVRLSFPRMTSLFSARKHSSASFSLSALLLQNAQVFFFEPDETQANGQDGRNTLKLQQSHAWSFGYG